VFETITSHMFEQLPPVISLKAPSLLIIVTLRWCWCGEYNRILSGVNKKSTKVDMQLT